MARRARAGIGVAFAAQALLQQGRRAGGRAHSGNGIGAGLNCAAAAGRSRRDRNINWFNGILAYLVIWWVVLLAVLPWGVKVPDKQETGHATSAPERPMLWRKAAATTVISAVVWAVIFALVESDLIAVRPR